jgi:hypothetical protein
MKAGTARWDLFLWKRAVEPQSEFHGCYIMPSSFKAASFRARGLSKISLAELLAVITPWQPCILKAKDKVS